MEASTLHAPVALQRLSVPASLLRLRSDEQLVSSFRGGSEDAFRAIHDRYRVRLLAYCRQMLSGSPHDAEDVLQDVFVRVYRALRANDRPVQLRAWMYRIAHNRCIDQLRSPTAPLADVFDVSHAPSSEPAAVVQRREDLRQLVTDVGRLPEQQRSALLMRELQGMSYDELASSLDVTVAAVKSLLVRARGGLVDSAEARDTACASVRRDLALACDRGVRSSGLARRHLRDCTSCREYRDDLRGVRRRLGALVPVGPLGLIWQMCGLGGGGVAASGSVGVGVGASGAVVTATKVALVCAVAAVTAGGALGIAPRTILHALSIPTTSSSQPHHQTTAATSAGAVDRAVTAAAAVSALPAASSTLPGTSTGSTRATRRRTHHHPRARIAIPVAPLGGSTTDASMTSGTTDPETGGTSAASTDADDPTGTTGATGTAPSTSTVVPTTDSGSGSSTSAQSGTGSTSSSSTPLVAPATGDADTSTESPTSTTVMNGVNQPAASGAGTSSSGAPTGSTASPPSNTPPASQSSPPTS